VRVDERNESLARRARAELLLSICLLGFAIAPLISNTVTIPPAPERIKPLITDRQDLQTPDRVHLSGWSGTRVEANERNRLVKLDRDRLLEGNRKRIRGGRPQRV
jgi:hypothetical protein